MKFALISRRYLNFLLTSIKLFLLTNGGCHKAVGVASVDCIGTI